jgi:BMFP domain-containing protein YqiC
MMAMIIFMKISLEDAGRRIACLKAAWLQPGEASGSMDTPAVTSDFPDPTAQRTPMARPRQWREAARSAGEPNMIDLNHIDDLARRLSDLVPPGLRESQEELQQTFKSALQSGLSRLDLVTREEFDVQRAVLLRTREKLDALERTVAAALEAERASSPQPPQH